MKRALIPLLLGGGKKAVYTPSTLADLVCWYDATAITGLNDGDKVASWNDLSGNSLHVTQATDAYRPVYRVNIQNGKPAVFFVNDNNNILTRSSGVPTVSQPYTIYAVFTATVNTRGPIGFGPSSTIAYIQRGIYWTMFAGVSVNNNILSSANATIISAVFYGENSILRANGNAGTLSGNPGTGSIASVINIGRSAFLYDGYIMEIFVCSGAHTTDQLEAGEKYLSDKWGISLP